MEIIDEYELRVTGRFARYVGVDRDKRSDVKKRPGSWISIYGFEPHFSEALFFGMKSKNDLNSLKGLRVHDAPWIISINSGSIKIFTCLSLGMLATACE